MAEMLANYADKVLRKGGMKGERKLVEDQLENLTHLFTYLYDKDLFLLVYRNQLARRLLQEVYEDFELEKQVITRLKVTCGMQQVNQMQGMLSDYVGVKEENKEFDAFVQSSPNLNIAPNSNFDF